MGLMLITHDLAVVAEPRRPARDHAPRPGGRGGADRRGAARDAPPLYPRALRGLGAPAATRLPRLARAPLLEVEGMVRDYPAGAARPLRAAGGVPGGARRQLHGCTRARASGSSARAGCGKSTLTRAVLGLEAMQGGSVRIEGEAVRAGERMPRSLRAKMQVVFQDPYGSFNPRHRVARLVAEPFHLLDDPPRGAARRRGGGGGARGRRAASRATRRSTSTSSPAASGSASPSPGR